MENHSTKRSVKRNWIQRNPRLFSTIFVSTSLCIFFSRNIYDAFIREDIPGPPPQRVQRYKS